MILEKEEQDMEDKFAAIGLHLNVSFLQNSTSKQAKPGQENDCQSIVQLLLSPWKWETMYKNNCSS